MQKPLCQNIVAQQVFAVDEKQSHIRPHSLFLVICHHPDSFSPQFIVFVAFLGVNENLLRLSINYSPNCIRKESSITETFTEMRRISSFSAAARGESGLVFFLLDASCYDKKLL